MMKKSEEKRSFEHVVWAGQRFPKPFALVTTRAEVQACAALLRKVCMLVLGTRELLFRISVCRLPLPVSLRWFRTRFVTPETAQTSRPQDTR